MASLHPYLNFNGNCEEAFTFYQSVFGGSFPQLMRFKDIPAEFSTPPDEADRIMHVSLPIGNTSMLMGCDVPSSMEASKAGNNFHISINTESKAEADRLFNGLAEGGKISMPMADAFWGSYFGMLTDRFGTRWMVSYDQNQAN